MRTHKDRILYLRSPIAQITGDDKHRLKQFVTNFEIIDSMI